MFLLKIATLLVRTVVQRKNAIRINRISAPDGETKMFRCLAIALSMACPRGRRTLREYGRLSRAGGGPTKPAPLMRLKTRTRAAPE
jgi:hypothetical protein